MISAAVQGFILCIGIIIPIGAQNAWVLNRGINRNHHLATAAVCGLCDAGLIGLGVFGQSLLLGDGNALLNLLSIAGVFFLFGYAIISFRSAAQAILGSDSKNSEATKPTGRLLTRRSVIIATLGITLLNPHVYLDTIVVLGAVANETYGESRSAFYLGSLAGSLVWFFLLSYAAAKMGRILSDKRVRIGIDLAVATLMIAIGMSLLMSITVTEPALAIDPLGLPIR